MAKKKPFTPRKQIGVGGLVLGKTEKRYLKKVIDSNHLSYGPMTQLFEAEFARRHGCKYSVFCNSGTSALHMSLGVLKERGGWEDGDEVVVPAVTFVATSNIVLHNGMKPVFVDVEPDTYNLDPGKLEEKVGPRTRAVIPVHLFGQPASMEGILEIARRRNLAVIEDSAETMFAEYQGRRVGSLGDIGCFSTYVAHMLVTGVGGFAATNSEDLAILLKSSMNHGRDSIYLHIDDDKGKTTEQLFDLVSRRFRFVLLGHSFRCTELEAAIGLGQLEQVDGFLSRRREIAAFYSRELADLSDVIQLPVVRPDRTHSFMMYPMVLLAEPKWALVNFLEERNIETREMMPLINQPLYRRLYGDMEDRFPVAKWINNNGFYVGCHPFLTDDEVAWVVSQIRRYFHR